MIDLSYVIISRNRRDTLLSTLSHVERATPLPHNRWEIFVVDNGSDDGSADAVAAAFPTVNLIRLAENEGMPARNHGIAAARGRYVAFLDDDSYPIGDAIPKALGYLNSHPKTAALVARVVLPSGECEAPAMAAITLGGASVVRKSVLNEVGGFAREFFRQAEEYEFSFRIWQAGHRVERFEDVVFKHEKVPSGRCSALTRGMDIRNNLICVERYLPRDLRRVYRRDWLRRYAALAKDDGHADAVKLALRDARQWARREAAEGRKTLGRDALESIFEFQKQTTAVSEWAVRKRIQRVLIADHSKNLFATFRACRQVGLEIAAVADNHPAYAGMKYRGLRILADAEIRRGTFDGIVLSNTNAAHVARRVEQLHHRFGLPVLQLWQSERLPDEQLGVAA